jgi:hypothetical protein
MLLMIGLLVSLAWAITVPLVVLWLSVRAVVLWRACVPARQKR